MVNIKIVFLNSRYCIQRLNKDNINDFIEDTQVNSNICDNGYYYKAMWNKS